MANVVGRVQALGERPARAPAVSIGWAELVNIVHAQMRSIAGPSHDLDDLVQTALEQAVRSLDRFEGRADVRTFTYRICVNVALNHWRWWRRWLRRFELRTEEDHATSDPGPHEVSDARQRAERLYVALDRLAPPKRVVLTLADLEGLPARQIAEIVDCPEPTVRSRLRQARADLARLLDRDPVFCSTPEDP